MAGTSEKQRNALLLAYLREVARDLLLRGIIRQQRGQDVIDILRQEPAIVLSSVIRDLKDAGFSLKQEIAGAFVNAAKGALGDLISSIFRAG